MYQLLKIIICHLLAIALGALLHRVTFLVRESLDRLADRGGALTLVHENLLLFV